VTPPDGPRSSLQDIAAARRGVGLSSIVVLLLVVAATVAIRLIDRHWLSRNSLFYEQFATIEPAGLAILAAFAIAVLILLRRPPSVAEPLETAPGWLSDTTRSRVAIVLGVLIATAVGTHLVFHNYLFIDDEYSGWFQSVIYSRGHRTATVPAEWCRWIASLTPTTIAIVKPCTWQLSYLPIHALIRGVFLALRMDTFAEPVLAALSVILVVLIARRVWPDRPHRAVLSALFLAASTQFLVMSMTGFAMTAHLFFSLLWLWVYVRPERWALILLPWIGVLALGVHSPIPHVLFVAPFLFRFLIQRRFGALAYLSAVYGLGLLLWDGKFSPSSVVASFPVATPTSVANVAVSIGAHPMFNGLTTAMSLSLLATWSVPIGLLCALVALLLWNRLDGFARWLALSLLCTLGGRAFFSGIQGAGWGSRYAFAVLGNLAILAAIGTEFMAEALGRRRTYSLVAVALIVAVAVQLPLRGVQAERIVRPYYQTSNWMAHYPADVLIFDPSAVRYGRQMVRNDPFLRNSPKLMDGFALGDGGIKAVMAAYPGRVHEITSEEIGRFGLKW
jgi:hypothetical protein